MTRNTDKQRLDWLEKHKCAIFHWKKDSGNYWNTLFSVKQSKTARQALDEVIKLDRKAKKKGK